jgi:hypothetical protein
MDLYNIIKEELLKEVGDLNNVIPFDFNLKGTKGYFNIDENNQVMMFYYPLDNDDLDKLKDYDENLDIYDSPIFEIGYNINGKITQAFKSDLKLLNRILKTFLIYIKNVIDVNENKYYKPIFLISSQAKNTEISVEDPQKSEYYKYIILNNLPSNYIKYDAEFGNKNVYLIQKK